MTASEAIAFAANGTGYLYITDSLGTTSTMTAYPNVSFFYQQWKASASEAYPFSGARRAFAVITITATAAGSTTVINVNGVNQIGAAVPNVTGGAQDQYDTALDIAAAITAFTPASGPDYTAYAVGDATVGYVYLIHPQATSANNGDAVNITQTGLTLTNTDMGGGTDLNQDYDGILDRKFWINPTVSASATNLAGAIDVTSLIVIRPVPSIQLVAPVGNSIVIDNKLGDKVIEVNLLGSVDLDTISMNAPDGFTEIIVRAYAAPSSITLKDYTSVGVSPSANIQLSGALDFSSTSEEYITLRWDPHVFRWAEISRSTSIPPTVASIIAAGVPVAATPGVEVVTVPAGGGTLNIEPGSTGVPPVGTTYKQDVILDGSPTLTSNYTVQILGGTPIAQDIIRVWGRGAITLGANSLTVLGLSVPSALAVAGKWLVIAVYDGSAWKPTLIGDWSVASSVVEAMIADGAVTTNKIPNGNVTDDKLASGIDGAKLQAGSVDFSELSAGVNAAINISNRIFSAKVILTDADILAINGTPINLVSAPGPGFAVLPVNWFANWTFVSSAYITGTDFDLLFPSAPATSQGQITDALTNTSSGILRGSIATTGAAGEFRIYEDEALQLTCLGGVPAGGDSTAEVTIFYQIWQL